VILLLIIPFSDKISGKNIIENGSNVTLLCQCQAISENRLAGWSLGQN